MASRTGKSQTIESRRGRGAEPPDDGWDAPFSGEVSPSQKRAYSLGEEYILDNSQRPNLPRRSGSRDNERVPRARHQEATRPLPRRQAAEADPSIGSVVAKKALDLLIRGFAIAMMALGIYWGLQWLSNAVHYHGVMEEDRRTILKPETVCELTGISPSDAQCDQMKLRLERPDFGSHKDLYALHFVGQPLVDQPGKFECRPMRLPKEIEVDDGIQSWRADNTPGGVTPCLANFYVKIMPEYQVVGP
jgi:hypothetical protein